MVFYDKTPGDFRHAWSTGTCLIVGDSILTEVDQKRLSKNDQLEQLVKFRAAAINHLKRHIVLLLKKKPEHIILHIGTNDAVLKMARQILDALIQPKHYITNILSTYKIVS